MLAAEEATALNRPSANHFKSMKSKRKSNRRIQVSDLEPGLSLTEAAAKLGVGLPAARNALKKSNYIWEDGRTRKWSSERRAEASRVDWSSIDWGRSDLALAHLHKVSRQRVWEMRKQWAPK